MENNIPKEQQAVLPTHPSKEHSYFTQLFIVLAILGVFFLGGTFLFIRSQKSPMSPPPLPVKNTAVEHEKEFNDMNTEVETVEASDVDMDLKEVDQEMKNL